MYLKNLSSILFSHLSINLRYDQFLTIMNSVIVKAGEKCRVSKRRKSIKNRGTRTRGLGLMCDGEVRYPYIFKPLVQYFWEHQTQTTISKFKHVSVNDSDWEGDGEILEWTNEEWSYVNNGWEHVRQTLLYESVEIIVYILQNYFIRQRMCRSWYKQELHSTQNSFLGREKRLRRIRNARENKLRDTSQHPRGSPHLTARKALHSPLQLTELSRFLLSLSTTLLRLQSGGCGSSGI